MQVPKKITATFPIPNDPDKGEITLRHISPGEMEDIQGEMGIFETIMKPDDDGKMSPEIRQNTGIGDKRYLLQVRSIDSWRNVRGEDGKDLPCTPENIIVVCREVEVMRDDGAFIGLPVWLHECRVKLAEKVKADRMAQRKN